MILQIFIILIGTHKTSPPLHLKMAFNGERRDLLLIFFHSNFLKINTKY